MLGLILIFLPFHFRLSLSRRNPVGSWSEPPYTLSHWSALLSCLLVRALQCFSLWARVGRVVAAPSQVGTWSMGGLALWGLPFRSTVPVLLLPHPHYSGTSGGTVGKAPAMKSIFNSYHLLHIYGLELGLHHSLALLLPPYPFLLPHQTPASPFPTLSRYFPG